MPSLALALMADMPTTDKPETDLESGSQTRRETPPKAEKTRVRITEVRDAVLQASAWAGHRAYRLGGETVSVLLTLGIAILFFASGLVARQSADLTALRPNFERWFSQSFDGARAELGDIELRWNPSDDTVSFTATDVVVYDRDDAVIQTLALMRATTTKANLLDRNASLRDVEIVGGEVTWRQGVNGAILAGLGNPQTVGGFGPVFRGRNRVEQRTQMDWLDEFRSVTLRDSRAHIVDEKDGLSVIVDVETLLGQRDGDITMLSVKGQIASDDEAGIDAGSLSLDLRSEDRLKTISLDLTTDALRPSRLAPPRGRLAVLSAIDVPLNAGIRAIYSRQDGLQSAEMSLNIGAGTVRPAGAERAVESGTFVASLSPGDEVMRVESITIDADRLSLSGSGVIREIGRLYDGDVGTSPKFDLELADTRLDLTPVFEAPLEMKSVKALGELDLDDRSLTLDRLVADFDGFSLTTTADIEAGDEGLTTVNLNGQTQSPLTAQDLLSLWPVESANGARRWIDRSILDGTLHNVQFKVALEEAFFDDPALTSERLTVDFDVRDGVVRYISTMDPLTEAHGSGRIDGNRFGFVLERGRINEIEIIGGDVDIPQLTPKGGDIFITTQGRGDVQSLLSLINQPPFQYMDKYGVNPEGFSGTADVTLSIKRPLLEFFDRNRIEYSVDGTFTDASAPFSLGSYTLSDADVTIRGGKDGLFLSGPANLGPWRADLAWEERYGLNGEPTRYRISGPMDRKTLDGFGFGFREFFDGVIDVDIEASGRGLEIRDAGVDLRLDEAEISFGEFWSKSAGDPGLLRASVTRSESGVSIDALTMQAPGLDLSGSAQLRPDLSLDEARLERILIDGLIDGQLTLSRDDEAQRLAIDTIGTRLNISNWVDAALKSAGGDASNLPLSVDATYDEIVVSPGYVLESGALIYRHTGEAVETLSLRGTRPDGPFDITLGELPDLPNRQARLTIPDASDAMSKVMGLEATRGGALSITAELPKSGIEGAIIGQVKATDFTVQNAPFLAQILSLASLTGIVDTLSGDGLGFQELDFDFALENRIMSVRDATLRGSAIGMTGAGDIALDDRSVDFSGTLVPAYTANSLLGDIPLIGDIFVGKDGEGVFAITYAVRGPYSGAQISINPLSALAPGFIRGIFRQSRDDLPESVTEEIESVRPSSDGTED